MKKGNPLVVIVEDEEVLLDILKEKLESVGFRVMTAQDGRTGYHLISAHLPSIVLLDIAMPEMNGFEVLQKVKSKSHTKHIPVIIISNSGEGVEVKKVLDLGACDYLIKADFTPEEVLKKVEACFQHPNRNQPSRHIEERPMPLAKKNISGQSPNQKTVLIIEDDPILADVAKIKLEKEGFEVRIADTGKAGIQALQEKKPDIVLLDVMLPDIDGFQVMEIIQEQKSSGMFRIPILFLSNFGSEENKDRALSLGAVDYMVKANFTTDEIVKRILQILNKSKKPSVR